jgi:putative ABC transport system substrate-binding protein
VQQVLQRPVETITQSGHSGLKLSRRFDQLGAQLGPTRRRKFLLSVGALLATPGSVFAQGAARTYRVAVVFNGSAVSDRIYLEPLMEGLLRHGYKVGGNLILEVSHADGRTDRSIALIQEAVARKPDVIVTHGSAPGMAAKKATATIPIVMANVGDPVAIGLIASLARPGGNITGNTNLDASFLTKSLEILHETFPAVRSFAVLMDPAMPVFQPLWSALQITAKQLRVGLQRFDASTPEEIDRFLADLPRKRPGALLVPSMPLFGAHRKRMIESLAKSRIIQFWSFPDAADLGALMSNVANITVLWRNAANFVHRILQGAKPSELPFEQATQFEFSINLKTAKALGIKIPQSVLTRADRVIE